MLRLVPVVLPVPVVVGSADPATIPRRVWPVVVDPIDGKAGRTWAHVIQKLLKVVEPFGRHVNPTGAVAFVSGVVWISASLFRAEPLHVLAARGHFVSRMTVLKVAAFAKAITALAVAAPKYFGQRDLGATAVTPAQPRSAPSGVWGSLYNHQAPESLPGEVDKSMAPHTNIVPASPRIVQMVRTGTEPV